jgi:hypothetical protein
MGSLVLEERQRKPRSRVHADPAVAHVHHYDEVQHLGVEALAGIKVGDGECQMGHSCEPELNRPGDHSRPVSGAPQTCSGSGNTGNGSSATDRTAVVRHTPTPAAR